MLYFNTVVRFIFPDTLYNDGGFLPIKEFNKLINQRYLAYKGLGECEPYMMEVVPPFFNDIQPTEKGKQEAIAVFLSRIQKPIGNEINLDKIETDIIENTLRRVIVDQVEIEMVKTTQISHEIFMATLADISNKYAMAEKMLKPTDPLASVLNTITDFIIPLYESPYSKYKGEHVRDIRFTSISKTDLEKGPMYEPVLNKLSPILQEYNVINAPDERVRTFHMNPFNLAIMNIPNMSFRSLFRYHVAELYYRGLIPSPDIIELNADHYPYTADMIERLIDEHPDVNYYVFGSSSACDIINLICLLNRLPHHIAICIYRRSNRSLDSSRGTNVDDFISNDLYSDFTDDEQLISAFSNLLTRPIIPIDVRLPVSVGNEYVTKRVTEIAESMGIKGYQPILFKEDDYIDTPLTTINLDEKVYANEKNLLLIKYNGTKTADLIQNELTSGDDYDIEYDVYEGATPDTNKLTAKKSEIGNIFQRTKNFLSGLTGNNKEPKEVPPPEEPKRKKISIKKKDTKKAKEEETRAEKAYESLQGLIGLERVKKTILDIVSVVKANRLYHENGIKEMNDYFHMVFYGNPGTAKTTVARLCADIFYKEGFLKSNKFTEYTRTDLVGQYVGHTAEKTKTKMMEGKGGVIFIDEAYSLTTGGVNDFGQEAIDTLVAMAEDLREDTIIILAGYEEDMKKFITANQGLKSRIIYNIHFDNYTVDQLVSIITSMATEKGFVLADSFIEKFKQEVIAHKSNKGFGNGRFARNEFTKAIIEHSSRIVQLNSPTVDDIKTLTEEDYPKPSELDTDARRVGFK